MDTNVSIDAKALLEHMEEMSRRTRKWLVISPRLHNFLLYKIKRIVASRGSSEGYKLKGYSSEPKYRAYKRALQRAGVINSPDLLRFKGSTGERLYPSLVRKSHPEHVYRKSRRWILDVGTRVPYAADIWSGGTNKFGERQPAREFLRLGKRTRKQLGDSLFDWVAQGKLPRTK